MTSWVRAAAASFAVFAIISCGDGTTDPENAPVVDYVEIGAAPTPPAGTSPQCYTGADGLTLSPRCPVLRWNGITYWVFGYNDPRNAVLLVAYDNDETMLEQSVREGTTQLYLIAINHNQRTVILYGIAATIATVPWSELVVD